MLFKGKVGITTGKCMAVVFGLGWDDIITKIAGKGNRMLINKLIYGVFLTVLILSSYLGYKYFSLSSSCRNFEELIDDSRNLSSVEKSIRNYLDALIDNDKVILNTRVWAKSARSMEVLYPLIAKLDLDWSKLDIPKEHAILKIYSVPSVNIQENYIAKEFGIGAGRNYLMFPAKIESAELAYVECGVYEGG